MEGGITMRLNGWVYLLIAVLLLALSAFSMLSGEDFSGINRISAGMSIVFGMYSFYRLWLDGQSSK